MEYIANKEIKTRVLESLQAFNNQGISREMLCKLVYPFDEYSIAHDRAVRDAVAQLRNEGYPIGKPINGRGYVYGNQEAVERAIAEAKSRIRAEYKKIRGLQGIPLEGQETIKEVITI